MNKPALNILIVDDDMDDAQWLAEVIGEMIPSCTFQFECDGIAALRYIKNNPAPDLVFLDLYMPLKNGLECLRDISNHGLLENTPVVIYSTSSNIKDIDQAYKYGAAFYIVKPTAGKQLRNLVRQAFSIIHKPVTERVDKANFVLMEGLSNRAPY